MNLFAHKLLSLKNTHNKRELQPFAHNGIFVQDSQHTLINFASNDYLGLQNHWAAEIKIFLENIPNDVCYLSSSSSRLLSGDFPVFSELESFIGRLYDKDCLLFNSGYHANVGLIQALSKLDNILFVLDEYAHASIFDGVRLAHTHFKRYKHNDIQNLAAILEDYHTKYNTLIIVSEGLFSMDGDFANLAEIIKLKSLYNNVLLYLDEAHSIGACGDDGLGLAQQMGYTQDIDFLILTFGKAISSIGACVVCNNDIKEYCINTARSLIYSTALPPLNVAFTKYVFTHLHQTRDYRIHLHTLSAYFRQKLKEHFTDSIILGVAHIISIVLGENAPTLALSKKLLDNGIFAPAIRYPTIPKGSARIRFCINAAMQQEHIDKVLEILYKEGLR